MKPLTVIFVAVMTLAVGPAAVHAKSHRRAQRAFDAADQPVKRHRARVRPRDRSVERIRAEDELVLGRLAVDLDATA